MGGRQSKRARIRAKAGNMTLDMLGRLKEAPLFCVNIRLYFLAANKDPIGLQG